LRLEAGAFRILSRHPRTREAVSMSVEIVSILVLVAIFLIATLLPIHMGALAIAAAFIVGMFVLEGAFDEKVDQISGSPD
jgi:NhaP-type Na+/H+ or K+/H+ antiporter